MPIQIAAEIIADSKSPQGHRITTMLLTHPRFILAELNTHKMISKNSASSRAVPFRKMVEAVEKDPFIPLIWLKDHKGMQGTELVHEDEQWHCRNTWTVAKDYAVHQAKLLNERYDVTKQICNRLLEPFMWHKTLVTATEWENFFALRAHVDAEYHMQMLAYAMLNAINASKPMQLQAGEWHIPYEPTNQKAFGDMEAVMIATARCAQTSYTIVGEDGKEIDSTKLQKMHDSLKSKGHVSPFEHCAQAMSNEEYKRYGKFEGWEGSYHENHAYGWCKNFRGFIPYRAMIEGENRTDERLVKK